MVIETKWWKKYESKIAGMVMRTLMEERMSCWLIFDSTDGQGPLLYIKISLLLLQKIGSFECRAVQA